MKTRNILRAVAPCVLAAGLCACAQEPRPVREEPPAAQATPAPPPPQQQPAQQEQPAPQATPEAQAAAAAATPPPAPAARRPPSAADVRAALERTYKGALVSEGAPAAVGDFNGDDSEDLIVAARPAPGRVAELNDELANWIVYDPLTVIPPDPRLFDPHQRVQKLAPRTTRPNVGQTDELLVVVHGYGDAGWRNPQALQTYLLKNVVGTELRPEGRVAARAAARVRVPHLLGDVLHERLRGEQGFLYWTGAGYGWLRTQGESGQSAQR